MSRPDTYPPGSGAVERRETHMSWVFLAGDTVFKLKKPVRFPYLDFSTLGRREAACRAEFDLNRRLARHVYLEVAPLVLSPGGLSIGGRGLVVDWLVVMRRLEEGRTLEHAIAEDRLEAGWIDRLVATLVGFYRHARRDLVPAPAQMLAWERSITYNHRVLIEPRLGLPARIVRRVDAAQRRFLEQRGHLIRDRIRRRRILDAHGDLRPEHIWLADGVLIIDCLEFNPRLRAIDPFDEIAYLSLECERLGAAWVGPYVRRGVARGLHEDVPEELFLFYRCHRASLRARLAIAHLLEPEPRTPEKWPIVAKAHLGIAAGEAARLERLLRTRGGR